VGRGGGGVRKGPGGRGRCLLVCVASDVVLGFGGGGGWRGVGWGVLVVVLFFGLGCWFLVGVCGGVSTYEESLPSQPDIIYLVLSLAATPCVYFFPPIIYPFFLLFHFFFLIFGGFFSKVLGLIDD